ncbi:MAG: hypothetical protein QM763_05885 [Agriterribacter sp.]
MPRFYDDATQKLVTGNTKWWCSGFYPGTLGLLYEETKAKTLKTEAEKRLQILDKDVVFTSASSLSARFRPSISSIQSWNKRDKFN